MSRALSAASVIDKNKITSQTAWVVLLEIDVVDPNSRAVVDIIRIARNDENIVFGVDGDGNPRVYQAGNFDINIDQQQNSSPSVSVTAQDQTGLIESRLEAMAGGVFSEVVMTVVNSARLDKPAEIEQRFQVTGSSNKDRVISFQLGAENPLAIAFPKSRQFKDRCGRRFRDQFCGYAGPLMTCDYTKDGPNGCAAHNNTLNFKGLPGLVRMNL